MSTPMLVDSKEEVTSASASVLTPMVVDSESVNIVEEQTVKIVFDLIDDVGDLLPRVKYNKAQCKRIADRFNTIGEEEMKSMNMHKESHGPVSDELFKILKRGQTLIRGYAESADITSLLMSRGDNRDEFKQFHEDLDCVCTGLGFKCLPEVKDSDLHDDAEKDKIAMLQINSSSDLNSKKRAHVVSEKTKNLNDFMGILPPYLAIERNPDLVIKEKRAGRPWVRVSDRDHPNENGWVIVHEGTWLLCDFAIKVFKCGADSGAREWNKGELLKEVQSLMALQHPHVLRLVGFGHDETSCFFVMELMDSDLKTFMLKNDGGFEKRDVINQVAKGMCYMHERGFAHGDLKCTNIMAKKLDKQVVQVKIGDLRGSQLLEKWDPKAFEAASKIRRYRWTAPEAIDKYGGKDPTFEQLKQSDVYSFGMTCYEIVTGMLPFKNIREKDGLLEYIRKGRVEEFNQFSKKLDEDLKAMIRKCWSIKPSERPTFREICLGLKSADRNSLRPSVVQLLHRWGCLNTGPASEPVNRGPSWSPGTPPHVAIIPHDHLTLETRPIGAGSAGTVFKATWLWCTVAVKEPKGDSQRYKVGVEVDYLIKVSHHPYIVQLIGLWGSEKCYWIVMEHMDSDLESFIKGRKDLTRLKNWTLKGRQEKTHKEILAIITKLALGMVYLHSRGLVHRDLKPRNVLLRDYNDTIDVKIADFGESHLKTIAGTRFGYFDGRGSRFYRAPEVLPLVKPDKLKSSTEPAKRIVLKSEEAKFLNESARLIIENLLDEADLDAMKATDVYSFGMVCYMVLTGQDPYSDLISNYVKVWNGLASLKWTSHPHPDLKSLVERCVQLDPTKRPTFEQICQDLHKISEPLPN